MRRNDEVFFFVLIDFLLQVVFFGLLLFVIWHAAESKQNEDRERQAEAGRAAFKASGVSSIAELMDWLTKLVPLDELRGTKDFIDRNGGQEKVQRAVDAVNAAGGPENVTGLAGENEAQRRRINQLEKERWGRVPCLDKVHVNGRLQPRTIATAIVYDDAIELQNLKPEMEKLLQENGLDFANVKRLSLADFRKTFGPVAAKQVECSYFVAVHRQTGLYAPMQTLWSAFGSV